MLSWCRSSFSNADCCCRRWDDHRSAAPIVVVIVAAVIILPHRLLSSWRRSSLRSCLRCGSPSRHRSSFGAGASCRRVIVCGHGIGCRCAGTARRRLVVVVMACRVTVPLIVASSSRWRSSLYATDRRGVIILYWNGAVLHCSITMEPSFIFIKHVRGSAGRLYMHT